MDRWKRRLVNASAMVAFLGLAFVIGGVTLWFLELAPGATSVLEALFSLVMHVLFGAVILFLGVHIERSELSEEERFAVIVWCYGGFLLMAVLSVWGHLGSIVAGTFTTAFASDFVVFTSIGGAFGVVSGVNWGRAARNRSLAEQNEEQRETLALLTRLLSHDIRNDISVVQGYADLLSEHVTDDGRSAIETIQDRLDETEALLTTADTLVKSIDEDREFTVIHLTDSLVQEVRRTREDHPTVDIETDIEPGLRVEADSLINQLFSNLLNNAVNHNDTEELSIHVSAEQSGGEVTVTIEDNGTGIPEEIRETCFELGKQGAVSDGDGIGLYLVSRLAEVYGGSVELEDPGMGGARFRITLPTPSK